MIEDAVAPAFGVGALAGRAVFDELRPRFTPFPAPQKRAALVNRVQRVDQQRGAGERQTGGAGPSAKLVEELGLACPGKPGFGEPNAKLGNGCSIHAWHSL